MFLLTVEHLEGIKIKHYHGLVSAEIVLGGNVMRDIMMSVRDFVGGRASSFEELLARGREEALHELEKQAGDMDASGVIGVRLDYEILGKDGKAIMVSALGTAVDIEPTSND